MRLCNEAVDVIQTVLTAAVDNMKRAHSSYDLHRSSSVPSGFVPVVFPYIQLVLAGDYKEQKNKSEEFEFPQHIQTFIYDLASKQADDVNEQVKAARESLEFGLQACETLSNETKTDLLAKLDDNIAQNQRKIDKAKEDAADDLKKTLPDDETPEYWSFLRIAQENGDNYAKALNDLGSKTLGDIINLYEMIISEQD